MRPFTRAAPLLTVLAGIAVACAPTNPGSSPAPTGDTQDLCRGEPVPAGWLMMNSRWDQQRCPQSADRANGVSLSTDPGDNVITIWRYDNKPVGTEQDVCEQSPTPQGWVASHHRWDPARCRLGRGIETLNVKTIQRVS